MKTVRLALCQINPTVGDLQGNSAIIIAAINKSAAAGADFIVFPELALTGYPPEDLVLKPQFVADNIDALEQIRQHVKDYIVVLGFIDKAIDLYNAAAIMHSGRTIDVYHKIHLPNYGVFDENRYFKPGNRCPVYEACGIVFGVNICEDIWYHDGPICQQAASGAQLIININASPYHMNKHRARIEMLASRARSNSVAIAYLNMVGGQDELVFDGHSVVVDDDGNILVTARRFDEDLLLFDLPIQTPKSTPAMQHKINRRNISGNHAEHIVIPHREPSVREQAVSSFRADSEPMMELEAEIYHALVLGTRDYVRKNHFKDVCIGLSGGIDSALVAAIAVDALGKEHVHGVFMPSPFTSRESRQDASLLAKNLGISFTTVSITPLYRAYLKVFQKLFAGRHADTTEENVQARIRGNILMAISNKFGWLVLTTGNKSEMSVGYATLYGDMAGGFAVIKDVPKTLVYRIAGWKNRQAGGSPLIPKRILLKEPTAELKANQKDTDSLPPYDVLDPILKAYVEEEKKCSELIAALCDTDCVRKIVRLVDMNEYKRRQSPPGIKITERAFGKDRRFPITNQYRSC